MITKEELQAVKNMRRYMRLQDSVISKANKIPLRRGTTDEHWWAITKMAKQCSDEGCTVLVEAEFKESSWPRPDIWLPSLCTGQGDAGTGIEIWKTETMKIFLEKMARYAHHSILIRVGYVTSHEAATLKSADALKLALSRAKMPREWLRDGQPGGCSE